MVRFINEIILKYLLGISKCTKLPGKKQKNKTISQNKYKFTYWTYLHIGNNPGNIFSKIFFFLIISIFFPFEIIKKEKDVSLICIVIALLLGFFFIWTGPALN